MKNELIQSTKIMYKLLQTSSTSGFDKHSLFKQIKTNLNKLEQDLSKEDFEKSLKEISFTIKKIDDKLSDPTFLDKIAEILKTIKINL